MKMIKTAALLALATVGTSFATAGDLILVDSFAIMQKSKEGAEVMKSLQGDIVKFQEEIQTMQKTLADEQTGLEKQAKVLSKDALQEKTDALAAKRKESESKFAAKEEALRTSMQRRQMSLRERQMAVVKEMSDKNSWVVLDKQTPGLLCSPSALDRTEEVLKAVDEKYSSKAKDVKVVASKDSKTAPKQTVKTA